ncbi:hypothetical protein POM88_050232 [Heracleum sosnowskyi]|uniref:FAF domain-containing protein n=1 Tax=Heracleum sosnowskyi TaxID=360622 RepID=A0AAD8GYC9_9APIA|nr:hypothetical protein POM88_050232 [Heracleum sosnowskyi]
MNDSQSIQSGENLPTFIRRKNLYLSRKNTLLITGSSGTTSDSVINGNNNEDIGSEVDFMKDEAIEKSIVKKDEKRFRVFPPLLSSLNRNGRPRFSLETVRKDGRLQISIVQNHFSEVVRNPQGGDRVNMKLLQTGSH